MTGWTAIVPVKPWRLGKSRLGLAAEERAELARAFSLDLLHAVTATPSVDLLVVVTAEAELWALARAHGAIVVADRPLVEVDPLNRAVDSGRRWAASRAPAAPTVVVPGDLPALTAAALTHCLAMMAEHPRAHVPDAAGTGTTMLSASTPATIDPLYGSWSARRHSAAGSRAVPGVDERCRLDVDTQADLARARHVGVGAHTAAALARITPLLDARGRALAR